MDVKHCEVLGTPRGSSWPRRPPPHGCGTPRGFGHDERSPALGPRTHGCGMPLGLGHTVPFNLTACSIVACMDVERRKVLGTPPGSPWTPSSASAVWTRDTTRSWAFEGTASTRGSRSWAQHRDRTKSELHGYGTLRGIRHHFACRLTCSPGLCMDVESRKALGTGRGSRRSAAWMWSAARHYALTRGRANWRPLGGSTGGLSVL